MEQAHARRPGAEEQATAATPLHAVPAPDDRESSRVRGTHHERSPRRGGPATDSRRGRGRAPHDAFLELAATSPAYRSYLDSGDPEADWGPRPESADDWGRLATGAALEDDPLARSSSDPVVDLDLDDLLAPPADHEGEGTGEGDLELEADTATELGDYADLSPGTAHGAEARRRTVRVGGARSPERRERPERRKWREWGAPSLSLAANPDRLALWAVILALMLALVAAATARGDDQPRADEPALQGAPPAVETRR